MPFTASDLDKDQLPVYFFQSIANPNATTLVIWFTSNGGSGIQFEGQNVMTQYDRCATLLLSSQNRNDYFDHNGLGTVAYDDNDDVLDQIKDAVITYGFDNLIFIGEGSGGTGAIRYGWKLAHGWDTHNPSVSILAFAPYQILADTATWNLNDDYFLKFPNPANLKAAYLFHETDAVGSTVSKDARDRENKRFNISEFTAAGFEEKEIEGAQHLIKAHYKRGDLFLVFDELLSAPDKLATNPDWSNYVFDQWEVKQVVLHKEQFGSIVGTPGVSPLTIDVNSMISPAPSSGEAIFDVSDSNSWIITINFPVTIRFGTGNIALCRKDGIYEDALHANTVFDVQVSSELNISSTLLTIDLTAFTFNLDDEYTLSINAGCIETKDGTESNPELKSDYTKYHIKFA